MVKTSPKAIKMKKSSVIISDQCNICFEKIKKYKGILSCQEKNCQSHFCFDCIQKWAKKENTCPCCKTKFNQIKKVNNNGKVSEEVSVEDKRQSEIFDRQNMNIEHQFMNIIVRHLLRRNGLRTRGTYEVDGVTIFRLSDQ